MITVMGGPFISFWKAENTDEPWYDSQKEYYLLFMLFNE